MNHVTQIRTLQRALFARMLLAMIALTLICSGAQAMTLQQQRDAFRAAYATAQNGGDWQPMAQGLENYPLYPYLQAAAFEHDLANADRAQLATYLARWPDTIPADDLRSDELKLLARNQDWTGFVYFYKPGLGDELTCDALQAKLTRGERLDFQRDLSALWNEPKLPSACVGVLDAANAQGLFTTAMIWERIERAADAGSAATIEQSAAWLPQPDASDAQRMADALRSPASLLANAGSLNDSARAHEALTLAFTRYAKHHNADAQAKWDRWSGRFRFDAQQRDRILNALALHAATDYSDGALSMLASLPPEAQSDATREWRVRIALARGEWNAAQSAVAALTSQEMQHDEWRYWRARVAQKLGQTGEAQSGYTSLAQQASYYGFLAADRANLPYTICPEQLSDSGADEQRLLAMPGLARAFEFHAIDMLQPARREWNRAFAKLSDADQRQAAGIAYRHGWYDRAVFAFANDDDQHLYEQRFPLADESTVVNAARAADIDPAWAYAIIRAESAWQTDAHSGANALGLMQLLPGTAQHVAQRNGLSYGGADDLYDPNINIPLGTHYLAMMATRYDGSPWLASASYNAGPGNVQRWVDARSNLEPDAFIATIPFKETREYVARVLSFETLYDWRLHGDALPVSSRMPAIGTPYSPSSNNATRKRIVCNLSNAPDTQVATPAKTASAPAVNSTSRSNGH